MMFVLLDNELRIAPAGTTMSHKEWFASRPELNIDYETVVRGYVKDGVISLYTGGDRFEAPLWSKRIESLIRDLCESGGIKMVYMGAIPTEPGVVWKPRYIIDLLLLTRWFEPIRTKYVNWASQHRPESVPVLNEMFDGIESGYIYDLGRVPYEARVAFKQNYTWALIAALQGAGFPNLYCTKYAND